MNENSIYDIAFSFDESITPLEKTTLFSKYQSSQKIMELGKSTIKNILGRNWSGSRFNVEYFVSEAKKMSNFIDNANIKTLRYDDPVYPEGLKQIPDYPFLLYYKGDISFDYYKSISIVGTRTPCANGIQTAEIYSKFLTEKGFTIISGLADGVDATAHKTCCDNNGKTIAVLGCGIDRVYPATNKSIARDILANNGGIISEYPPGYLPRKWYFPKRNRIIVGLTRGVLIVQAPERSGSLITAFLTTDYNRELFALNPLEDSDIYKGNAMLINSGAIKVESPEDILKEWGYY